MRQKSKSKKKMAELSRVDLVQLVARKHRITQVLSTLAVNTVIDCITKALVQGRRVEIRGFGTFEVRKYRAYKGRNPQNGKAVQVKAKQVPFFKAGKFKQKLKLPR